MARYLPGAVRDGGQRARCICGERETGGDVTVVIGQAHANSKWLRQLRSLSSAASRDKVWLNGAREGVEYLRENAAGEDFVIYASLGHVYLQAVLAPLRQLKKLEASELAGARLEVDGSWRIEQEWGGGRSGDRVYLVPPLDESGPLRGGEKLVFLRQWPGARRIETEVSQKFVHALDVHFVEERGSYCRVDYQGDLDDIVKLHQIEGTDPWEDERVVTVRRSELEEFAALASMGVVVFFDFNRYKPGDPDLWLDVKRSEHHERLLSYQAGVQAGTGSFVQGRLIHLPGETKRQIAQRRQKERTSRKEYAEFKIVDLVTRTRIETSCDPDCLSSYFDRDSARPRTMSPAFFSSEVLHKYKADAAKFELTERTISCRGAWHLTTYDINEAGQVHTYVGYLGDLPYREQLYWQSFNEWPKAGLSERAVRNDFMGEFAEPDPLQSIKHKIEVLDREGPGWWRARGVDMARVVQIPATGSENEWSEALLALDQFLVEGFVVKDLRRAVRELGRTVEKEWGSLKLLEECLVGRGLDEEEAKGMVRPLRDVHEHRSVVKGHSAASRKQELAKAAVKTHGSFRAHFKVLVGRCDWALGQITATMGARSNEGPGGSYPGRECS